NAEVVAGHRDSNRLPERSNATEEVAAVAPDYWNPKAMSLRKPRPNRRPTASSTRRTPARWMTRTNNSQEKLLSCSLEKCLSATRETNWPAVFVPVAMLGGSP